MNRFCEFLRSRPFKYLALSALFFLILAFSKEKEFNINFHEAYFVINLPLLYKEIAIMLVFFLFSYSLFGSFFLSGKISRIHIRGTLISVFLVATLQYSLLLTAQHVAAGGVFRESASMPGESFMVLAHHLNFWVWLLCYFSFGIVYPILIFQLLFFVNAVGGIIKYVALLLRQKG